MQDNTTDKELVLQAMREYGQRKAAELQEASTGMTGDCCTDGGKVWRSTIDNNVWAPTAYPRGREEVTGTDVVFVSQALADILENIRVHFGKPVHINSGYRTGDRVIYNGHIYESTINNNVWSPDTYPQGWTELGPVGGPFVEEEA